MDLISGLKSELFRPLVTLVVPGAIALGPYVIVTRSKVPPVAAFWASEPAGFVTILLVAVLAGGLILEDVGSRIETLWDRVNAKQESSLQAEWHAYLQLQDTKDSAGQHYLDSLLLRMKFELSMAPALLLHAIGLIWINAIHRLFTTTSMGLLAGGITLLALYLLWESRSSAVNLIRVRRDIIATCRRRGRHTHWQTESSARNRASR